MRFLISILCVLLCWPASAQLPMKRQSVGSLHLPTGTALLTNIFYDTFDDGDIASPLAATRTAYPGPGVWTNTQANGSSLWVSNYFTLGQTQIVAGALGIAPQTGAGTALSNTMLIASSISNTPGLAMITKLMLSGPTTQTQNCMVGFERATAAGNADGATANLWFGLLQSYGFGANYMYWPIVDNYSDYEICIVTIPSGNLCFIRGTGAQSLPNAGSGNRAGHFGDWILYAVHSETADATVRPVIQNAGAMTWVDSFRVLHLGEEWTNRYHIAAASIIGQATNGSHLTAQTPDATIELTYRQGDITIPTDILKFRMVDETNGFVWRVITNRLKLIALSNGVETVKLDSGSTYASNTVYRFIASCLGSNLWAGKKDALFGVQNSEYNPAGTNVWIGTTGTNFVVWPMRYTFPENSGIAPVRGIYSFGDSRVYSSSDTTLPQSSARPNWQYYLCQSLNTNNALTFQENPPRAGHSGFNIGQLQAVVDYDLSHASRQGPAPEFILINMGINSRSGETINATWTNNVSYILDAHHVKWPDAKMYITQVSTTNSGFETVLEKINGYFATYISTNTSWCFQGPDESLTLTGSNAADGLHLNHDGCVAWVAAWRSVLGL